MGSKIILAAMLCLAAVTLAQAQRYQAIGYVYGTRPYLSRRFPCTIWMITDGEIVVIGTDIYQVLRTYKPPAQPAGSFAFDCVSPVHRRCDISFNRSTNGRYDYKLVVEWKDSVKIWEVNRR